MRPAVEERCYIYDAGARDDGGRDGLRPPRLAWEGRQVRIQCFLITLSSCQLASSASKFPRLLWKLFGGAEVNQLQSGDLGLLLLFGLGHWQAASP